jgi:XTP/dITP diphosphohydrolase
VNRLVVASTNAGKVREIIEFLDRLDDWAVQTLQPGLPVAEETGSTFLENAVQKAEFYSRLLGDGPWVVADDSGLVVDALNGRPGVESARYAPTDEARNVKLLDELKGVSDQERSAEFVCALSLARKGQSLWTAEATVEGSIALDPTGDNGFGYDPLFRVPDFGRTMGQLPSETKNRISHRGRALAMLRGHLESSNF